MLFYILVILGIIFIVISAVIYLNTWIFIKNGVKVEGIVVKLLDAHSGDGPSFKTVFEYLNSNKERREFIDHNMSNPACFKVGDKIDLLYSPNDETKVKVNRFWYLYRVPILLFTVGIVFLIVSFTGIID